MENVDQFLATHIDDPKWHLVIQFVAGLVGDKIKEAKMNQRNLADIQKRYYIFSLLKIGSVGFLVSADWFYKSIESFEGLK